MFKWKYKPLCCLLLLVQIGWAQPEPINFTSIAVKDGLLSNSVSAIIKDHYGLMWFATDDGLNKFDGTNFTVYRHIHGDTTSLRSNEILALHEDRAGNLWIGTGCGGISLYDRKKDAFVHFPVNAATPQLPPNAVIRGISSDSLGKVWVAQFENLFMIDPATRNTFRINLETGATSTPAKKVLTCVFVDSKQRVWTGTTQGLYLYIRSTNLVKRFMRTGTNSFNPVNNDVRAITEDKSGNILIGTSTGVCSLLPDGSGFAPYTHASGNLSALNSTEIYCIVPDEEGKLWIGTSEGLYIINTHTQAVTSYKPEAGNIHSLTSKVIRCAYIDKQGSYWLGTFQGGINKYDKALNLFNLKPATAFYKNGRSSSNVSAFAENRNGNVFIGTDGGGLFEFNRKTEQLIPVDIRLPAKNNQQLSILALERTRANELYIGTYAQGLIILDPATGAYRQLVKGAGADNLSSNDIFCIKEDSRGNVWIGTNGQGVNVLKDHKVIAKYTPGPDAGNGMQLPLNGYIRTIEEDRDGNIWIGSHGGGIAVYHPNNGQWTTYTQSKSRLPGDKVQVVLCDTQGNIWVGTFGAGLGLFNRKNDQFITFSEKDGLQNATIYQIVEDLNGQIWLSTNTGISAFDPASKKVRNYTHHNGLQNSNFVHTSGIRLSNGEMIFGGLQGFNYFNPAKLTINRNVPVVLLTELRISNKTVVAGNEAPIKEHISVAKNIRLEYKQNFALSFVALNFTIPKQNRYAYKLEGFDKDWNYTGTINTASYTNLDPGEYTFRVKASNNDGVWSTKDTVIKIYVHPPFWRTTYAYLFYLAAIGGLLLYSRYRGIARIRKRFLLEQERQEIRRVQELDRLKIRFLTNLSHDFRTPISLIMGPVDQLINSEKRSDRLDKLNMIKRNARRLLNLVNQLLDFRKMEEHELKLQLTNGDFVSFIKEVTDSFRDFAERKHIHFSFSTGVTKLETRFDHDKMERILFNLLSNAFKFTLEGGAVTVDLQLMEKLADGNDQWVSIKVTDSGIGIPSDKRDLIFDRFFQTNTTTAVLNQGTGIGLSITKEFIKMHGGTIEVESEPGQGSTFIIQMPLKPATEDAHKEVPVLPLAEPPHDDQASIEMASPFAESPGNTGNAPLVLLVEDNEDFRFYLRDNLRNSYKVVEAANGKEGWQKALAHHPQLIVSDISMPGMDGIDLVQKLKADKRTSHIPVILLTALTAEEQQIEGLATGANDYITKPFNVEVLNARIRNLLHLNNTLKSTYTRQIKVLSPELNIVSADEKLLHTIVTYLEENLANPEVSVERLSKEVGMSRSSLYNKLLELTGQTPIEYIISYRLNRAASLMEKSDLTVSEIAYQVGFSTPNYFSKLFRKKFNMLPSEFIAKMRK